MLSAGELIFLSFLSVILIFVVFHIFRFRLLLTGLPRRARRAVSMLPMLAVLMPANGALEFSSAPQPRSAAVYGLELSGFIVLALIIVNLVWLIRSAPKAQKKLTILALGAHPDDIELGCGAALLRYKVEGHETHGLVFSIGEGGLHDPKLKNNNPRKGEAERGGRVMHLDSLTVMELPDTRLSTRHEDIIRAIEESTRQLHPDVIFTHNRHDLHRDHHAVYLATMEAARRVPTLLCYENPNTPSSFQPNFFIEVSLYLEHKIKALKCHASQHTSRPYMEEDLVHSLARVRGGQARLRAAEAFEAIRFTV
jgi:LmbE family N-acetylglucosaminyl deacetylase